NRTAYVAWYAAITGVLAAAGALSGGALGDLLSGFHTSVAGRRFGGFQVMILLCFVLCGASIFFISRIREGKEKPVGFLLSALMTPTIFRTFLAINVLGRGEASAKVAQALRNVERGSGAIAVRDVIRRLDDPDAEVREEAARALGRIGSVDAVEPLIRHLREPSSTIRTYAAQALGRIGDPRAMPWLIEELGSSSEDLAEACCRALGRIGARSARKQLLELFAAARPPRVIAAASEALSRLGAFEAALDILPRMHASESPILARQLAIALGNLLGAPGQAQGGFYPIVTGDRATRSMALERLDAEAQKNQQTLFAHCRPGFSGRVARRQALAKASRGLHEAVAREDHVAIVDSVSNAVLCLCQLLGDRDFAEDEALGFAFMRGPRLGLGLWFSVEVKALLSSPRPTGRGLSLSELTEIDSLLGLYFLATYQEEGLEDEA
ncbi:MAG TPA: HEAT repeat domain-containing protein, partial [Spirochaetia bacterium]|nr:HEAT repeat domain-containing protein [Spirochaetia bacterium]